jgi:hypothetical protein
MGISPGSSPPTWPDSSVSALTIRTCESNSCTCEHGPTRYEVPRQQLTQFGLLPAVHRPPFARFVAIFPNHLPHPRCADLCGDCGRPTISECPISEHTPAPKKPAFSGRLHRPPRFTHGWLISPMKGKTSCSRNLSRGRPPEATPEEMRWIARAVHDDSPQRFKFPYRCLSRLLSLRLFLCGRNQRRRFRTE